METTANSEPCSFATCRGCGNLHINPSAGVTYCSAEECVRLIHTKDQDAKADAGKVRLIVSLNTITILPVK